MLGYFDQGVLILCSKPLPPPTLIIKQHISSSIFYVLLYPLHPGHYSLAYEFTFYG